MIGEVAGVYENIAFWELEGAILGIGVVCVGNTNDAGFAELGSHGNCDVSVDLFVVDKAIEGFGYLKNR